MASGAQSAPVAFGLDQPDRGEGHGPTISGDTAPEPVEVVDMPRQGRLKQAPVDLLTGIGQQVLQRSGRGTGHLHAHCAVGRGPKRVGRHDRALHGNGALFDGLGHRCFEGSERLLHRLGPQFGCRVEANHPLEHQCVEGGVGHCETTVGHSEIDQAPQGIGIIARLGHQAAQTLEATEVHGVHQSVLVTESGVDAHGGDMCGRGDPTQDHCLRAVSGEQSNRRIDELAANRVLGGGCHLR